MKFFYKCMFFAGICFHLLVASAMSCQEAQQSIINTTSQIKANHQNISSFNLLEQQQLLERDQLILKSNNYQNSISYLKEFCIND